MHVSDTILLIESYSNCGKSWLHAMNVPLKLVSLILLIASVVVTQSYIVPLSLIMCVLILAVLIAKIRPIHFIGMQAVGFVTTLWFVVFIPFMQGPSTPAFTIGGLEYAFLLLCKGTASVSLVILFMCTTPLPRMINFASRVLPAELVEMMVLSYKYIFIIIWELESMMVAQKLRGGRMRTRNFVKSMKLQASILEKTVERALDRSTVLYEALYCRGYTGRFPRYNVKERVGYADFIIIIVSMFVLVTSTMRWI